MKHWNLLLAAIILSVSCTDIADEARPDGGAQGITDTAPVCVFDFTDSKGRPVQLARLIVISDVLEESPVFVQPEKPSARIQVKLTPLVNRISTYRFYATTSDGTSCSGVRDMYIPIGARYEKTIELSGKLQTTPLLTDKSMWKITDLGKGVKWYNFEGMESVTGQRQVINVLEADIERDDLELKFLYYPGREKISNVGNGNSSFIAVTNASYGSGFTGGEPVDNTYIRVDGVNYKEISIGPEDTGNWYKHEAAVWLDGSEIGFIDMPGDPVGAIEYYKSTKYPNLFSSPLLLVKDYEKINLRAYSRSFATTKVDPRTILAVTHDRKLLLVTIDGRWQDKAYGMTYKQAQDFLVTHFLPRYAISMDGGGSTCMYIRGKNIVNYPCEGNASDTLKPYKGTFKERGLVTFFAISEK